MCIRVFCFVLLIFLGEDTAVGDPNGSFRLTTDDFTQMGRSFAALDVPKLIVQEGGCVLESIGANVAAFLRGEVGRGNGRC